MKTVIIKSSNKEILLITEHQISPKIGEKVKISGNPGIPETKILDVIHLFDATAPSPSCLVFIDL